MLRIFPARYLQTMLWALVILFLYIHIFSTLCFLYVYLLHYMASSYFIFFPVYYLLLTWGTVPYSKLDHYTVEMFDEWMNEQRNGQINNYLTCWCLRWEEHPSGRISGGQWYFLWRHKRAYVLFCGLHLSIIGTITVLQDFWEINNICV